MKHHLKRIAAPKTWNLERKKNVFVTRPNPSGHPLMYSIPLSFFLKDMLGYAKTTKEVRYVLRNKEILVDGKRVTDLHTAVGLFDVVSIKDTNESFRIVLNPKSGYIQALPIKGTETTLKVCKVVGKRVQKSGKMQLNLSDGRNYLMSSTDYAVGDSVAVSLTDYKLQQKLPLKEGASVFLIAGKHLGSVGTVQELKGDEAVVSASGESFIAKKSHLFVVGTNKPIIHLVDEL